MIAKDQDRDILALEDLTSFDAKGGVLTVEPFVEMSDRHLSVELIEDDKVVVVVVSVVEHLVEGEHVDSKEAAKVIHE